MARKTNKNQNETGNGADEAEEKGPDFGGIVNDAPEGFRRVNPLEGARLYFKPKAGAVLQGILLGRFKRTDTEDDKEQFFFQVRVTKECEHCTDSEGEASTAEVGMVVQLDERTGLRDLVPFCDKKTQQEIFVRAVEKVGLRKGPGSFWRWDVFAKDASAATIAKIASIMKKDTDEAGDFGAPS